MIEQKSVIRAKLPGSIESAIHQPEGRSTEGGFLQVQGRSVQALRERANFLLWTSVQLVTCMDMDPVMTCATASTTAAELDSCAGE